MKLVLLPGLDGTGELFSPLLQQLSGFDCVVIPLPKAGSQDYESITAWVRAQLPEDDFVLLAESFSGPVGVALAVESPDNMKGVIFVATFLSPPNRLLLNLARGLPIQFLSSLPFADFFHKALFLGSNASAKLIHQFKSIVGSLPSDLLRARLDTMRSLVPPANGCHMPAVYIQATSDRLVGAGKAHEFSQYFDHIMINQIEGPHFILQARTDKCVTVIAKWVARLMAP